MIRRVKSLAAIDLLACFTFLALVQVVSPLQVVTFGPQSGISAPTSILGRNIALEVPAAPADMGAPRQLRSTAIEQEFVPDSPAPPVWRQPVFPLGPFWTGRILRRIASAEPDGH